MRKLFRNFLSALLIFSFFFQSKAEIIQVPLNFSDVPLSHPNYQAITYLKNSGIIKGYSDGTFKPDNTINRAEAIKMILGLQKFPLWKDPNQNLPTTSNPPNFRDTDKTAWYYPALTQAYNLKLIKGYPDGTFRPNSTINKAESAKIFMEYTFFQNPSTGKQPQINQFDQSNLYSDIKPKDWHAEYFAYLKSFNLLQSNSKNQINPSNPITRGEMADLIFRSLIKSKTQLPAYPNLKFKVNNDTKEIQIFLNEQLSKSTPISSIGGKSQSLNLLRFINHDFGHIVFQECEESTSQNLFKCKGNTFILNPNTAKSRYLVPEYIADLSSDGKLFLTANFADNSIKIFDTNTSKQIESISIPSQFADFGAIVFSEDNSQIAYTVLPSQPQSKGSIIQVYDLNTKSTTELISSADSICQALGSDHNNPKNFIINCSK